MPNPFFRFKQFTVRHDLCAMKVGTDGVLLGAWADCASARRILDVGTGSGLIALMLAQRSQAVVDAIDLDENAVVQAKINVEESPFSNRIRVFHSSFQDYCPERTDENAGSMIRYDLIVSNPPFFSDSLKSPEERRTLARHNEELPFDVLVRKAASLLSPQGKFCLIIPVLAYNQIDLSRQESGLHLSRKTVVYPTPELPPKRLLLEYSFDNRPTEEENLIIEISRHVYSEDYRKLTGIFYLKM